MKAIGLIFVFGLFCPAQIMQQAIVNTPLPAGVTWTHIQGGSDFSGSLTPGATSCHPSLASTPTVGNVVAVGVVTLNQTTSAAPTGLAIADAQPNSYTLTGVSPATYLAQTGSYFFVYIGYFIVSGTPSKTINVTWSGAVNFRSECWADEFHKSSSTISYATDAANTLSTCSGTSATTPSTNPGATNSLLYSVGFDFDNALVAPAAGSSLNGWTGATGGPEEPNMGGNAEYNLAASGSTNVAYTCGGSGDHYGAMTVGLN